MCVCVSVHIYVCLCAAVFVTHTYIFLHIYNVCIYRETQGHFTFILVVFLRTININVKLLLIDHIFIRTININVKLLLIDHILFLSVILKYHKLLHPSDSLMCIYSN
jgi:hypothetical protein